jgi:hypothetical protein
MAKMVSPACWAWTAETDANASMVAMDKWESFVKCMNLDSFGKNKFQKMSAHDEPARPVYFEIPQTNTTNKSAK